MSILIATFPSTKHIAKKVAKALKAQYTEIFVEDFPDSEFHLALKVNPSHKTVIIFNSITKDPDEKIVETVLAGGLAKDYGAKEVILMATYFPYLRQDKHFLKYDSESSMYVVRMFSMFDKIITVDPHLHRIKHMRDFISKAESITANGLIATYIKKRFKDDFTIVGPDEESAQWGARIADQLGKKVVVLKKTRFSSTHIKQEKITEKLSKNVIFIDDIISTGKTLAGAMKMAKQQGAKNLFCIGIHGLLVNGADKLLKKYGEVVTTNTIPGYYSKIDVSPIIIEALKKYK